MIILGEQDKRKKKKIKFLETPNQNLYHFIDKVELAGEFKIY
jgi:hypothetical protein